MKVLNLDDSQMKFTVGVHSILININIISTTFLTLSSFWALL